MLDDIGHEAIDTHKAGPTVRHDHIGFARPGGINFHTGTPVIFENNTVQDCGTMIRLQGNPWARIQGNTFQGSENTAGPWAYGDSTLTSESPSSGVGLSDNVEVGIVWNRFGGIPGLLLFYKHVGSKMRIGHTTDMPEPFGIGPGPVRIYVHENTFVNCGNISTRKPGTGWPW